jgi:hypothetical protein
MTTVRDTQDSESLSTNGMVWRYEVVFARGGHLGLDLTDSPPGSKTPLCVQAVRPGHAADRSKKMQAGDTLVSINDVPLKGFVYEDAIDVLRQASQGPVTLVCERTRFYQIVFDDQGGLGLRLTPRDDEDLGAVVDSIVQYSEASQHNRISRGHMIVGINGKWFTNETYQITKNLLKNTPKPLSILFQDPSVLDVIRRSENLRASQADAVLEAVLVPPEEPMQQASAPPLPPKTNSSRDMAVRYSRAVSSGNLELANPGTAPELPFAEDPPIDAANVASFVGVTGASEAQATKFLRESGGDLMIAMNCFFESPQNEELMDESDSTPSNSATLNEVQALQRAAVQSTPMFDPKTGAPMNDAARGMCVDNAGPLFHHETGEPVNDKARAMCIEAGMGNVIGSGNRATGALASSANATGTVPSAASGAQGVLDGSQAIMSANGAEVDGGMSSVGGGAAATVAAGGIAALTLGGSGTISSNTSTAPPVEDEGSKVYSMKVKATGYGNSQVGKCGNCGKKFAMPVGTKTIYCPHCNAINESKSCNISRRLDMLLVNFPFPVFFFFASKCEDT